MTDLERVGNCLARVGVKINLKSDNLCLEIQDRIRELSNNYNKTKFMLKVYKNEANKRNSLEVHKVKESNENTYKNENIRLKKLNNELMSSINGLKVEVEKYKAERINNIIYGSDSRDLKAKEYLL